MVTTTYLFVAAFLLLLNAFFVLAEFASVKLRSTRVQEMIDAGHRNAKIVQHIQKNLDEYLSVCQLGITFTSIGLGFVGEPSVARLIEPFITLSTPMRGVIVHTAAITVSYLLISIMHIVVGELVPKSLAIRYPERSALLAAPWLRMLRWFFYVPLVLLNSFANMILKLLPFPAVAGSDLHSEDEVRIILAQSQSRGLLSFRRLLFLENIFDLDDILVRDSMKPRSEVKTLDAAASWSENILTIMQSRFSRFPLVEPNNPKPLGIIHVKDLILKGFPDIQDVDLRTIARPYMTVTENMPIENVLAEFQHKRAHVALVVDKQDRWMGFITLEDITEHIVGAVRDEFETETLIFLADVVNINRIVLGLKAEHTTEAIRRIIGSVNPAELPAQPETIIKAVLERERAMVTYLGRGLAIPHCRLPSIDKPALIFARSEEGVPTGVGHDKAHLFFMLVTPAQQPQVQIKLLARIAGILESEFVHERLLEAPSAKEVLDAITSAETAVID